MKFVIAASDVDGEKKFEYHVQNQTNETGEIS